MKVWCWFSKICVFRLWGMCPIGDSSKPCYASCPKWCRGYIFGMLLFYSFLSYNYYSHLQGVKIEASIKKNHISKYVSDLAENWFGSLFSLLHFHMLKYMGVQENNERRYSLQCVYLVGITYKYCKNYFVNSHSILHCPRNSSFLSLIFHPFICLP